MISREATIRWKGYDPDDLSHGSNKKVWAICEDCGHGRWLKRCSYSDSCSKCGNHKTPKTRFIPKEEDRFISNTGIDRITTIEKMGYDPINLVVGSAKKVWCICKRCGRGRLLSKFDYHDLCLLCTYIDENRRQKMSATSRGISYAEWEGFAEDRNYCLLFNERFKEKIRELFNRLCFLCGMDEEENGQKLSVHHTNYDKDCLCNSSCEFVPLCKKCHGKTNHKRQYWEDLIMCHLYPDRITMVDQ